MDDAFRFADELGPQKLVHIWRPAIGLKAAVAIDNIACGPSIGGVRMAPDVSAEEAFRLARAMTLKNAAGGLAHGGGKSVIFADPRMPAADKERLIRAFARSIAELTDYIPGPDMGTDELAMGWVKDEIGRAVGLPREIGGIPLDELGATGFGVVAAIEVAMAHLKASLAGARIVIQGFGSVGKHAARFLAEKGAILVGASDTHGTLADDNGLDVAALIALKNAGRPLREHPRGRKLDGAAIVEIPCDIWIPAARPT
jgi:glutamate dehydrogenase (NAD(P)+)